MNLTVILKNYNKDSSIIDKERTTTIAQLNVMQGAKQQCTMFLSEFDNEENALVNNPNDKTRDLGTLGE